MRIFTLHFDRKPEYRRMLNVLSYSVRKHIPDAEFHVISGPVPKSHLTGRRAKLADNLQKMKVWNSVVKEAGNGEEFVLMDCDMLVLQDFSRVWHSDFDVAITKTGRVKAPINTGVLFVRANDRSREFFHLWAEVCQEMWDNETLHKRWRFDKGYFGISQAALGKLLEEKSYSAAILGVPSWEYNAVSSDWKHVDENTKIVHFMSGLKKATFEKNDNYPKLVELWHRYEEESTL